jgi:hypothetical protein
VFLCRYTVVVLLDSCHNHPARTDRVSARSCWAVALEMARFIDLRC